MSGPATAKWESLVEAEMSRGVDRSRAIKAVEKKNPEARQAMLVEANQNRPRALRGLGA